MASKAEKKRNRREATLRALRMGQGAGRPREEGERYACGKLKPRKNERLIEAKRALVGEGLDIALADDPLDFVHAKGWLSTVRYRTALAYRDARSRAKVGAPRLDGGGVEETSSTTGVRGGSFHEMNDAEIVAVFDHVFRDAPAMSADEREAKALQTWKRMEAAMSQDQRRQVSMIVIDGSWAWWITELNMQRELVGKRLMDLRAFEAGLDAMRRALRPPSVRAAAENAATIEPAPAPKRAKAEVAVSFVDEDGQPLELTSRKGRPFSVVHKVPA